MTQSDLGGRRLALVLVPVLLLFVTCAILFARAQQIWIDETTQLSGATLRLEELIGWLTGRLPMAFGVPDDRMPPISYMIDMLGWRLWGNNETAFRLFHMTIAGAGVALLIVAAARRFGWRVALVAGLVLALSPKLTEAAVEIRAYPIFFALSCAQVALLLRGEVAARTGRLLLFVLLGVLSAYTHFFGVVATSAFTLAAFIDARDLRGAIRIILAYALLLLLWSGLVPFIFGAAANSTMSEVVAPGLRAIVSFPLLTLTNSAVMIKPLVALLYFGGAAVLMGIGAIGLFRLALRQGLAVRHEPALALTLALLAGIAVSLVGAFVLKGFNPLSPRYNLWMLPAAAVLIGIVADGIVAPPGKVARIVRLAGLGLFLIGATWTQIGFLRHASWFVHGPARQIETMMAQARGPVAVVHVGSGWIWGYFPLYWRHHEDLAQWWLQPDGKSVVRIPPYGEPDAPQPLSVLASNTAILVSYTQLLGYRHLRAIDNGTAPPVEIDQLVPALGEAGWQSGRAVYQPGNYAFIGQLYERPDVQRASALSKMEDLK